jgi:hypothetical protein
VLLERFFPGESGKRMKKRKNEIGGIPTVGWGGNSKKGKQKAWN